MKRKRKVISLVLSMCLVLAACFSASGATTKIAQAAKNKKAAAKKTQKKVKLNKKKITLMLNSKKKVTLKVSHATKKVIWKTSNKKVAVVKKVKGKKKSQAVIQAKGEGTCNIVAKVGKKKFTCKVTVKANDGTGNGPDDSVASIASQGAVGVYVTSASATGKAITVNTKFYNYTDNDAGFGLDFSIEKWSNGQWIVVERTEPAIIPSIAVMIQKQTEGGAYSFTMNNAKEDFTTGKYRINTSLSAVDSSTPVYKSAEFWLSVK